MYIKPIIMYITYVHVYALLYPIALRARVASLLTLLWGEERSDARARLLYPIALHAPRRFTPSSRGRSEVTRAQGYGIYQAQGCGI